jgi:DNA-directed RNA polymerase specialized sigma24 family protein
MAGGDDGFDAFFWRVHPAATRVAVKLLGRVPAADEAVIEAFTGALARWRTVSNLPYPNAWVLRATARRALAAARSTPLPIGEPDEETHVRLALLEGLGQLPARSREAVVLHYVGRLPIEAVAVTMQTPPDVVRRDVADGLEHLREWFGEDGR